MIQIDDAGSGSLIGGTVIGLYWVEKDIYRYDIIPLEMYTPENFKKKAYQIYVIHIVERILRELSVPKYEDIQVCQGYIFDALRRHLAFRGLPWNNTKIEGVLQDKVENTFADYAVSLGLPKDYILYTKYPFHFHRLLKWVYADLDHRSTLCKTGWKSWQKYKNLPTTVETGFLEDGNYYCLKCGKKIRAQSPIKIIKFVSDKENVVYLHLIC